MTPCFIPIQCLESVISQVLEKESIGGSIFLSLSYLIIFEKHDRALVFTTCPQLGLFF